MDGASLLGHFPSELEDVNMGWKSRLASQMQVYQHLAGCWPQFDDFYLRTFKRLLDEYGRTTKSSYVGLHIRHGDKVEEGFTVSVGSLMPNVQANHAWASTKDVWVATDDSDVLQAEINDFPAYRYNWTKHTR